MGHLRRREGAAFARCPLAHLGKHVFDRGVDTFAPSAAVLVVRAGYTSGHLQALGPPPHGAQEQGQLGLVAEHDPLGPAPDSKGGAAGRAAGQVLRGLQANDHLVPAAKHKGEDEQGHGPLETTGASTYGQAGLQLHDHRIEARDHP